MAKKMNEIKTKVSERLQKAFYNDCLTAYEERKSLYYDVTKLPRGQVDMMWKEACYIVSQKMKWRFIYKLSLVFGL